MVKPAKYAREVITELNKVTWPTRQQTWEMTSLVIIVSIVVGAYVGALDLVFQRLITLLITRV